MSSKKKEISKELSDELLSVSFSESEDFEAELTNEASSDTDKKEPDVPLPQSKKTPNLDLNKRVVTLEYLDKLERATMASTKYEAIRSFSHTLSNLSIILLSVSIITYLIFYFIDANSISLLALIILAFEAVALLGITIYSISKTSSFKHIRDLAISDLSTCSHIIGNPRGEVFNPLNENHKK